jgi:hypothetical protein
MGMAGDDLETVKAKSDSPLVIVLANVARVVVTVGIIDALVLEQLDDTVSDVREAAATVRACWRER